MNRAISEKYETLTTAINEQFPTDDESYIQSWLRSAIEYDQPLTVEEYADYRNDDEYGL